MTDNIDRITNDLIKNYKTKKFKDALVQADILTKHKIKNKQINFICGELFLSFRLYKKALFSLAYSIKLDPNFYMAYKLLGITEYSLGNFNKALKIYNAAKKLNNLDADLFFNIAKSYSDLGKYDLSIKNYIKSLKNLSRCGIKTVCYNFMPVLDWTRTLLEKRLNDGSKTMEFNKTE